MHGEVRHFERLVDGLSFPEGPCWHDGELYFSDMISQRVSRLRRDGTCEVLFEVQAGPSGLGFVNGELLVVSMSDRRILRFDGSTLHELADLRSFAPGPLNDMIVDASGGLYVGNFGSSPIETTVRATHLLRRAPDGGVTSVATEVVYPNGMAITPDGGTLYLAESHAHRVTAFDRAPDGSLAARRVWAEFDAGFPDGICLDAEGALWVAEAHGSGALRCVDGEVVETVRLPDGLAPLSLLLGGEDGRTLYVCAVPPIGTVDHMAEPLGCLLSCRVEAPGPGFT